ncbi:M20/M25/M40 family metallo-hydrolase [Miniimonas arenae]|uniref:M20/M25/M40 family metallo-hydrolase n=1 Tax=Miniimonas arenae TaxID=676201 RepID=UPI0024830AA1|nr:M20/M25/M40 family metallo-hydrolase [Miniimonas arenae]
MTTVPDASTPEPLPLPTETLEALERAVDAGVDDVRADLEALVRIPSVSAPAFDQAHVEASASAVADLLRGAGLPQVEVLRMPGGAPAVVAHRPGPDGAPTVLLYAHHDVQPPGEGWTTEPFEPSRRGDRLFGRGAADDKAGVMAHVGALRALAAVFADAWPVGVTVFVEGEEEVGSPSFTAFLDTFGDRLRSDVVVVADSANWKVGIPALTTSLRGLVDLVVRVDVLEHAVHSGVFGGPVLDALTLLARLVATLHDEDGSVAVEGLVRGEAAPLDYSEEMFRAEAGVLDGVRLAGTGTIPDRLWMRPALSVIGIDAPTIAHSSNTIRHTAAAKLSLRLAPGQDPAAAEAALIAHLHAHAPFGARLTVTPGERGEAFLAPHDAPAMRTARAAFARAWGHPPVDMGMGGSIPFIADLLRLAPDATILVTGVEDPDSRAHGADESVHLGELRHVVVAEALLLAALGAGCAS